MNETDKDNKKKTKTYRGTDDKTHDFGRVYCDIMSIGMVIVIRAGLKPSELFHKQWSVKYSA